MKNIEVFLEDPRNWWIVDFGYQARIFEGIDVAEAIWVGSKAISLDALSHAGEVHAHIEHGKRGAKVVVDTMDIIPKPEAEEVERHNRSMWPKFARQLQYKALEEDLAAWEMISALYEFTYASKRAKGEPQAGIYMLHRAGQAFEAWQKLKFEREEKENAQRSRFTLRRQGVAA